jgi:MutS domain II/MutS domain I
MNIFLSSHPDDDSTDGGYIRSPQPQRSKKRRRLSRHHGDQGSANAGLSERRRYPQSTVPIKYFQEYDWLVNVTDADGNPRGDAYYDSRTIRVPPSAWGTFNAFETRHWKFKQKLWDSIVLFRSRNKYYLLGEDASKAKYFPEVNLLGEGGALYAIVESQMKLLEEKLIYAGERVAVVEQERSLNTDTSVNRLARILTLGTFEESSTAGETMENYCLSIKEEVGSERRRFGLAFLDATIGHFFLSTFTDDTQFTILRTLLTQIRPIQLVVKKSLSTKVRAILKTNCCRRITDHFMQVLPKYVAMLSRNLGCSAPASKLTEASSSTPSFTPIFATVHAYVEMPSNHVLSFLLSSEGPDFLWLGLE